MITILYITLIVISLVFFVGIFLIYRKFAPIIKKMMENLEKLNNISPNIKTEGYRNVMKEQIKEIQDYINKKIKKYPVFIVYKLKITKIRRFTSKNE